MCLVIYNAILYYIFVAKVIQHITENPCFIIRNFYLRERNKKLLADPIMKYITKYNI